MCVFKECVPSISGCRVVHLFIKVYKSYFSNICSYQLIIHLLYQLIMGRGGLKCPTLMEFLYVFKYFVFCAGLCF